MDEVDILFFCIDDKSLKVVGIESDAIFLKIDVITNAILDSCEPKIHPNVTLQILDDKTVIVVEIQPAPMRPYYIKSQGIVKGTYVRCRNYKTCRRIYVKRAYIRRAKSLL